MPAKLTCARLGRPLDSAGFGDSGALTRRDRSADRRAPDWSGCPTAGPVSCSTLPLRSTGADPAGICTNSACLLSSIVTVAALPVHLAQLFYAGLLAVIVVVDAPDLRDTVVALRTRLASPNIHVPATTET
ncbi:hypothetical protein [Nocardia salmonicida]|uniref:hypothetical protein n=1 Tax=Nocardia salmonicida TaxID=53431 RepID=UPI0037AB1899